MEGVLHGTCIIRCLWTKITNSMSVWRGHNTALITSDHTIIILIAQLSYVYSGPSIIKDALGPAISLFGREWSVFPQWVTVVFNREKSSSQRSKTHWKYRKVIVWGLGVSFIHRFFFFFFFVLSANTWGMGIHVQDNQNCNYMYTFHLVYCFIDSTS